MRAVFHSAAFLLSFALLLPHLAPAEDTAVTPVNPVAAPTATAGAGIKISTDKPHNIFQDGEAVTIKIATAAEQPVALTVLDADGQPLASITLASTGGNIETGIDPQGKRYLAVVAADPKEPGKPLAQLSLAVLPPAPPQDRRFGFNARPDLAALTRRLGGVWVRNHIPWEQAGEDKPFTGTGIEKVIGATKAGGCEVFGISNYSLPWASVFSPDDKRPMRDFFSPPRPAPWDAYIADAARRIKDRVPVFEVWNEANFDMFWRSTPDTFEQRVADYSSLLKRTAPILRREAPGLLVTNGSLVDTRESDSCRFLRAILEKECADAFDILNVHYYHGTKGPERVAADTTGRDRSLDGFLGRVAEVQGEFKIRKPVWMTEMGWPTVDPGGWGAVSEAEQADFLVRSHVVCFASGVEVVLWFDLASPGFGILNEERGPKPALPAYAQLVQALQGRTVVQRIPDSTVHAYLFTGEKQEPLIIAWALEPKPWPLPAGYELVRAENLVGEKLAPKPDAPIELTPRPVYLYCRPR